MAILDNRPVALVLGSGPRLGYALLRHFASHGYRAVGARRNLEDAESLSKEGILLLSCEIAHKDEIDQLWPTIEEKLGQPPSVVIFEGKKVRIFSQISSASLRLCYK
jgi:NAD(P)-dependent dehydrogenase (short-subunit alcohol dehydrogenase family)